MEDSAAAAPPPTWASLPIEVLFRVFSRLRTVPDLVAATGVCRHWGEAARHFVGPLPLPAALVPPPMEKVEVDVAAVAPRWASLPSELLFEVFSRVSDPADLLECIGVCCHWREAALGFHLRPSPPLSAAAAAANLPMDVLHEVFSRLDLYDLVHCSLVCSHWMHAAREFPDRLPRLLIPSAFGRNAALFGVFDGKIDCSTGFPRIADRARLLSSFAGGWLATALDHTRGHVLLTIDRRCPLPDSIQFPHDHEDEPDGSRVQPLHIHAIALSESPTVHGTVDGYVAAAITGGQLNVVFWRYGMRWWSPPVTALLADDEDWSLSYPVDDIIHFRGALHTGFYVLHGQDDISAYVPNVTHDGAPRSADVPPLRVTLVRYVFYGKAREMTCRGPGERMVARYLLVSRDQLFMVKRYKKLDQQTSSSFDIFVLEGERYVSPTLVAACWRRYSFLTGRLFFLARGCSRAVETGFSGGQSWICFLDDTTSFGDIELLLDESMAFPCEHIGRTRYLSDHVSVFSPPEGRRAGRSPWMWYFP